MKNQDKLTNKQWGLIEPLPEQIRKGSRLRTKITSTSNRARARAPQNVDVIVVRSRGIGINKTASIEAVLTAAALLK